MMNSSTVYIYTHTFKRGGSLTLPQPVLETCIQYWTSKGYKLVYRLSRLNHVEWQSPALHCLCCGDYTCGNGTVWVYVTRKKKKQLIDLWHEGREDWNPIQKGLRIVYTLTTLTSGREISLWMRKGVSSFSFSQGTNKRMYSFFALWNGITNIVRDRHDPHRSYSLSLLWDNRELVDHLPQVKMVLTPARFGFS